jgi:hypothetical protein
VGVTPPGKTLGLFELVAESPTAFVFSLEDALASYPIPALLPTDPPIGTARFPVIVFDLVMPRGLLGLLAAPGSKGVAVFTEAETGRAELAPAAAAEAALAAAIRAVFSLMVAESTVFCLLKLPVGGVA